MRRACLVPVAALAIVLLGGAADAPLAQAFGNGPFDRASSWCGRSVARDWACREKGSAYAGSGPDALRPLPRRGARPVFEGERVATAAGASARLSFRDEAHCTLGGGTELPSEAVTRWGEDVLMLQLSGDSVCSSPKAGDRVETFCNPTGTACPVRIRGRGTVLTRVVAPEAIVSLTESFRRFARITICSGFFRVWIVGESGQTESEAAGGSSGNGRFVITVEESLERTKDETVTPNGSSSSSSESSSASVEVVGSVPGRGRCAEAFVREQEESTSG